jgi:hypothetical protein
MPKHPVCGYGTKNATFQLLLATVDELEPKTQNQDSPHRTLKVGEKSRFPDSKPQDVFTFTLVSS